MTGAALAAVPALLGACSYGQPYPAHWPLPAAAPVADCRALEGNYVERGERGARGAPQGAAYLSALFFGSSNPGATRVSIALPRSDTLEIAAWAAGDATPLFSDTLSATKGEFACERGALVIHKGKWVNKEQAHMRQRFTVEFKASGDFLLARAQESVIGLAVVFPVVATETHWYRFARIR